MLMLKTLQFKFQFTDFNLAFQFFRFFPLVFVMVIVVIFIILMVTMFTKHRMPLGPTLLFGDLAGFHRLLDAFTNFMQFMFVILCGDRDGS